MEKAESITLYGENYWASPFVFPCFVTLTEKKIPFKMEILALKEKPHQTPEYQRQTLTAKVPALRHRDFWLAESSAIIEYLEETFPFPDYPNVLPNNPQERARARQIMAWLRSDLFSLRKERTASSIFYQPIPKPLSAEAEQDTAKLLRIADQLISTNRLTLFPAWSVVDCELAFALQRLLANRDSVPAKLTDYVHRHWEHPSAIPFLTHTRPPTSPHG